MRRSRGFAMVELFVALGVMALVGVASLSLVSSSLRLMRAAQEDRELVLKAESLVMGFLHERLPDRGEEDGFRYSFVRSDVEALGLESYVLEVEGRGGIRVWFRL